MNRAVLPWLAVLALAVAAGCGSSRLVTQQSNPDYVGKSFKSVMVVGVASDEIARRTYEDRVVALLAKRGLKGIPAYSVLGTRGRVEEARLREAIAQSQAEGVIISRVTRVARESGTARGATVTAGYATGVYGYYSGGWQTVTTGPQQISGPSWTVSETRLFDARTGALAWTGMAETRENDDPGAALMQYVDLIFDAMVTDRVL